MNWVNRVAFAALLATMVSGCALSPGQDEGALPAETDAQEAKEAQLAETFKAAVEMKQAGDSQAAKAQFEQLAEQHPERSGPLANLGIIADEAGETELARQYFEAVLMLDEQHPVALNHLGVMAREAGDFEAAERYYQRALAAEADYVPAMLNLAFLLDIYLGRPAEALPLYEEYKSQSAEPHPRLEDWIFDAKNRL